MGHLPGARIRTAPANEPVIFYETTELIMPQDALQNILTEAGLALAPLRTVNTPQKGVDFLEQLGYNIPPGSFGGALPGAASQAGDLITAVRQLTTASGDGAVTAATVKVLAKLGTTINAIKQLQQQLQAGGGIPNIGDFALRLTDFLLLDYFERTKPQLHAALLLIGLIEKEDSPPPNQPKRKVHWNRVGQFFTHPQQVFNDVYHWSTDFDTTKFLARLEGLMRAASLPGGLYPQADTTRTIPGNTSTGLQELRFPLFQKGFTPATYRQFGITFSPAEAKDGKKKGMTLLPYLTGTAAFHFDVCDRGELVFNSTADIKGVGAVIRPPFNAEGILNLASSFQASLQIHEKPEKAAEIVLIGKAGGAGAWHQVVPAKSPRPARPRHGRRAAGGPPGDKRRRRRWVPAKNSFRHQRAGRSQSRVRPVVGILCAVAPHHHCQRRRTGHFRNAMAGNRDGVFCHRVPAFCLEPKSRSQPKPHCVTI